MSVVTTRQPRTRAQVRRRRDSWVRQVPVEKILLGGQARLDGHGFAAAIGDPLWTSRPILEGPHAALLRAHAVRELDDADVLGSDYGQLGRRCLALRGRFRDAEEGAGLLRIARDFLTRNSADVGTQRMLGLLDSVTGAVLVVDVPRQRAGGVPEQLERGISNTRVHDLGACGADEGRRLFACVRDT